MTNNENAPFPSPCKEMTSERYRQGRKFNLKNKDMKKITYNEIKFNLSKIAQNVSLLIEIAAAKTITHGQSEKISALYQSTIELMYKTAAEFLIIKGDKNKAAAITEKRINQTKAVQLTNESLKELNDFLGLNIPSKFLIMESINIGKPLTKK